MFKRPDSDIFGTKQLDQAVKIKNDSYVDPNEAFKKKNDENFGKYMQKLGNVGRKNIDGNPEMTKVNEKVTFDEEYHKDRKYMDLQSSIFCDQTLQRPKTSQQNSALKEKKVQSNETSHDMSYGRKNTLKREVESLPYNRSNIKGNASQLFDFDVKVQTTSQHRDQPVLIPHQMQWDQHDSIRYNHHKQAINTPLMANESNVIQKVQQTKSVQDPSEKQQRNQTIAALKSLEKNKKPTKETKQTKNVKVQTKTNTKKEQTKKQEAKKEQRPKTALTGDIQVRVLKGWDNKFMEELSKYCKLYSTPMTKFELQGAGKALICLKKTKKWEAVTDWLTKDAKLKIRVTGN